MAFPTWINIVGLGFERRGISRGRDKQEIKMAWKTPKIAEIAVGMEINCYACAEL